MRGDRPRGENSGPIHWNKSFILAKLPDTSTDLDVEIHFNFSTWSVILRVLWKYVNLVNFLLETCFRNRVSWGVLRFFVDAVWYLGNATDSLNRQIFFVPWSSFGDLRRVYVFGKHTGRGSTRPGLVAAGFRYTATVRRSKLMLVSSVWCYRSGTVNSKSFVGKVLLRIKWKFKLN